MKIARNATGRPSHQPMVSGRVQPNFAISQSAARARRAVRVTRSQSLLALAIVPWIAASRLALVWLDRQTHVPIARQVTTAVPDVVFTRNEVRVMLETRYGAPDGPLIVTAGGLSTYARGKVTVTPAVVAVA